MNASPRRKVAVFLGTRPEGIKLAPVIRHLVRHPDLQPLVVSTGQHAEMLTQVIDLWQLPVHRELQVMRLNQSLAELTARVLSGCDEVLRDERPDFVLVQGDTTTALAVTLCAFYRAIPIGHVEAGLRTGNYRAPFPEEANRVLVARLASLHFAPTANCRENLLKEDVDPATVFVTGNTVIDALKMELSRQTAPSVAARIEAALAAEGVVLASRDRKPLILVTCHRRETFGEGLESVCRAVGQLAERFADHHFIYLTHRNPNANGTAVESLRRFENVRLLSPQPYSLFVALLHHCKLVLTDSGGIQEEAPGLGKPVLVLRETTERPEGVAAGVACLVGIKSQRIVEAASELLTNADVHATMARPLNPYGDGLASERIVQIVARYLA